MNRSSLIYLVSVCAVGLAGTFAACSTLEKAKSPEARVAACTATALLPMTSSVERAEQVAAGLRSGEISPEAVVLAARQAGADAEALRRALEKCAAEYDAAKGGAAGAPASDAGASSSDAG